MGAARVSDPYCFVESTGKWDFERFRLVDFKKGYWTGAGWSQDQADACLYADFQLACQELREIELAEAPEKNKNAFSATVVVDVISGRPLGMEELTSYLGKTARLILTDTEPSGAVVFLQIDWATLKPNRGGKEEE
jgi:hypothetical protein